MNIKSVGIQTQPQTSRISNPQTKSIRLEQEPDSFQKSKVSTAKKIGIAAGILATLGTITAIVLTKGKAIRNQKLLNEIPKDLQVRFERIKNLKGEEFTHKAYNEIVEHMGLKGIAPKKIGFQGESGFMNGVQGGYHPIEHTITYTKNFVNAPKEVQVSLLSHELLHCKQFTNMLRTEGIGVEKYVECEVANMLKQGIKNDPIVGFNYNRAKSIGKEKEFLEKVKESWTKEITEQVSKNFEDILKLPKIKADSPEGIKAFKDLTAAQNYEGLGIFGIGSDAYRTNPLEVDAYGFGEKMEQLFKKYIKATK